MTNPDPKAVAAALYQELMLVDAQRQKAGDAACVRALERLLERWLVWLTEQERITFHTLFSRIIYIGQQHNIPRKRLFYLHVFRHKARGLAQSNAQTECADEYELGLQVLSNLVRDIYRLPLPETLKKQLQPEGFYRKMQAARITSHIAQARVLLTEIEPQQGLMRAFWEQSPEESVLIRCDKIDRTAIFNENLQEIAQFVPLPCTLNLLDIEVDEEGNWRPTAWVLEPDYLLDVTAVAECYKPHGADPVPHLLKRFLPMETSLAMAKGNIANFMLDKLMAAPELEFKVLQKQVFKLHPLAFCLMTDDEVKQLVQEIQLHYNNIKQLVQVDLAQQGINRDKCYLEPSFISNQFGFQGRLDLLHRPDKEGELKHIVELKSGRTFNPNKYGINPSHYIQTLIYDLMVRGALGDARVGNFIFYSGMSDSPLRFAPAEKVQQDEALNLRNRMVALEHRLMHLTLNGETQFALFDGINPKHYAHLKGFEGRDILVFNEIWEGLTPLMKLYFVSFSSFIAREQRLAKMGIEGLEEVNGFASLWLNELKDKEEQFEILFDLVITDNKTTEVEPIIVLNRTEFTPRLANFRQGDLVVLYPSGKTVAESSVLRNQLFKGTLIAFSGGVLTIRLRSSVLNQSVFIQNPKWIVEHDALDSSFISTYRSLFHFAKSSLSVQRRVLGLTAPKAGAIDTSLKQPKGMTAHQFKTLQSVLCAEDYFLLWGPPGSGKTSVLLHHLVRELFQNSQESIVILAYTNRAVDEICESIEAISPEIKDAYIRIGSRYSTQERFRDRLFDSLLAPMATRKELLALLNSCRILVATVASWQGKLELLKFKNYNRVIIDEASQILEPAMAGIVASFPKAVLIGDHLQLPAVVQQRDKESAISAPELLDIGLTNLRNSYFERMYRLCEKNEWHQALGCLHEQGRMHAEIMAYPAAAYYKGKLSCLPQEISDFQVAPLPKLAQFSGWQSQLAQHRVAFLPTAPDIETLQHKTNLHETEWVIRLVQFYMELHKATGATTPLSLGIITPYRAQIALIRNKMEAANLDPDQFTTDTVERYQGGARDIIIISLCTNKATQIQKLVSLSDEGVDRKFNVALTRARARIVVLGNPELMATQPVFADWLAWCESFYGATIIHT